MVTDEGAKKVKDIWDALKRKFNTADEAAKDATKNGLGVAESLVRSIYNQQDGFSKDDIGSKGIPDAGTLSGRVIDRLHDFYCRP